MYKVVTVEDKIRVGPEKLALPKMQSVKEAIADKFESVLEPKTGVILAVVDVDKVGEGKIIAGDAGVHYMTTFKLLVFKPELQETITGEVIDNTEFGAFVRMGPMDGLVHISQLMDDYVSYDGKNSIFLGKETKRTLKKGDKVRARIISVSFTDQNKIGLTMRQPGLGSLTWLEDEKNKRKKAAAGAK